MNKLCKTFAAVLSSPSTEKWLLPPIFILQSSLYSTKSLTKQRHTPRSEPEPSENLGFSAATKSTKKDLPRPSEIPFQVKVANSVSLIGSVSMPVQFESSPDGKSWAATIITQEKMSGFPTVWIPVIFEGDLAHVAACHLKETNLVHIVGQLSADTPPFTLEKSQASVQVMVQSVSFVQDSYEKKKIYAPHKHDVGGVSPGIMEDNISVKQSWNQLLAKPHEWLDNRLNKNNQTGAAFEHKGSGKLLCIDESTPEWILSKLDSMTFAHESEEKSQKSGEQSDYWTELLSFPERWRDYRNDKKNGKVKPGYPDFKCKKDGQALWLNSAPKYLLPKLEGLEFDVEISGTNLRKDNKKEASWKDLMENPNKWWDNRLDKRNKKSPDFKHKDTGEGLWVESSPTWVLPKLPPPKAKNDFSVSKRGSLLS